MSLENGGNPENPEAAKTPEEKAVDKVIQDYLSFQSSGTKQDKLNRIHNAQQNENIRKYASALIEAGNKEGWEIIKDTAGRIRNAMLIDAEALKLPVSVFGKDASWALLDLGQRYHEYLQTALPEEGKKDKRVNPFDESDEANNIRWDVSDRQLAYQARRAYYGGFPQGRAWRKAVDADEATYGKAFQLLRHKGKEGQLTFLQETKLGDILHQIAEEISERQQAEAEMLAENAPSETPVMHAEAARPEAQEIVADTPAGGPSSDNLHTEAPAAAQEAPLAPENEPQEDAAPEMIEQEQLETAAASAEAPEIPKTEHHHDTIGKEMRDSLRSLGGKSHEKAEHGHDKGKHDDHGHDDHGHGVEPFHYTAKGLANASLTAVWYLPLVGAYIATEELGKTSWDSIKGMFSAFWKLAKKGFSFKALNESAEKGGGSGGHGGHEKHDDHSGGHGHDAHGGDHGHKKDDHGHGGGGHH